MGRRYNSRFSNYVWLAALLFIAVAYQAMYSRHVLLTPAHTTERGRQPFSLFENTPIVSNPADTRQAGMRARDRVIAINGHPFTGNAVLAEALDVTDATAVQRFVAAVATKFGKVDICVTNAGGPPAKGFLAARVEDWRKAVDLNFLSTVFFAREVIPHMQRHHWGRISTLTSISTKRPVADLVLSNAVRAAVVGLVKSLANEFGKDGILVNNVGPGYTATDRLKELATSSSAAQAKSEKEIVEGWAADAPLKRLGNPKEVADTIVWLASERASYITGQTILVDGGLYKGL